MKFIVLTPIMGKNNKTIAVGSVVELGDEDAANLLACGAVRPSDEARNVESTDTGDLKKEADKNPSKTGGAATSGVSK